MNKTQLKAAYDENGLINSGIVSELLIRLRLPIAEVSLDEKVSKKTNDQFSTMNKLELVS